MLEVILILKFEEFQTFRTQKVIVAIHLICSDSQLRFYCRRLCPLLATMDRNLLTTGLHALGKRMD